MTTLLSIGLGTGLSPFAPGTAGSALGLAVAWILVRSLTATSPSLTAVVGLLMSGLLVGLAGVPASSRTARALGTKDPGCIVIDEIAGQLLASAAVPLFRYPSARAEALTWAASFFSSASSTSGSRERSGVSRICPKAGASWPTTSRRDSWRRVA